MSRWSQIIEHLLNIRQQEPDRNMNFSYQELLAQADLIVAKTGELTANGFSFILLDTSSQVHQILLAYLKRLKKQVQSKANLIQMLKLIFNLALTETGVWYKIQKDSPSYLYGCLKDLHQLGLVTVKKPHKSSSKFCVNGLMHSFLTSRATT